MKLLPKTKRRIKKQSATTKSQSLPPPQPGKQEQFLNCVADVVFYGGAAGGGKTVAALLDAGKKEYLANPEYNAVIFRRTYPEITNAGGILDESQKFYNAIAGRLTLNPMNWRFPSGAKISFRHLQYDKTVYEYQGSQIARIYFEELTHFSEAQFFYLLSRNRSTSGVPTAFRGTCNPDADTWVADFISWYLGEDGFPIEERSGSIRYFSRIEDEVVWGNSIKDLTSQYPTLRDKPELKIKSFTFIPAKITDNPILLDKDPGYLANLEIQHPVEKARLLGGNWKIRFEAGTIFDRTWFEVIDRLPGGEMGTIVRFWDFAATAKEVAKDTHFYSAGCKACIIGRYIVVLDLITDQRSPGELDNLVSHTSQSDGVEVKVRWELEGGSAGKLYENQLKKKLQNENSGVDACAVKPMGDKVTRAIPTANAAAQGRIKLLRGDWVDKFLNAMGNFDGSPKPLTNDIVDSFDGAFALLDSIPDHDWSEMADTI